MRAIHPVITLCLPAFGLAQGIGVPCASGMSGTYGRGNGFSEIHGQGCIPGRAVEIGGLQVNLRTDPPSAALSRSLSSSYRGRGSPGESYFGRTVIDGVNHVYLGYEMILEEQQPGTYLATFGKISLTPMEAAVSADSKLKAWSIQALPAMPEPKLVHDGDTISLELMTDAATGAKLIEDIEIHPFSPPQFPTLQLQTLGQVGALLPNVLTYSPANRPVPTVDGTARDFTTADAELQLMQPRVTLNGIPQSTVGRLSPNVHGPLVWFYLPNHGRYVLSLAPRPDLEFTKAGEARGGAITFTLGADSIRLECPNPVASGNAPYNLYVLHDPDWEPTAQAQKGQFATGSVDPGELAELKRK
jgi:hypothetical protein